VLVPRGYHPVGAPYGYDLYYLNVMAARNGLGASTTIPITLDAGIKPRRPLRVSLTPPGCTTARCPNMLALRIVERVERYRARQARFLQSLHHALAGGRAGLRLAAARDAFALAHFGEFGGLLSRAGAVKAVVANRTPNRIG